MQETVEILLAEQQGSLGEPAIAKNYISALQSLNGIRPIRFIEFRTPSLRPGDVYRAYFEVSRAFLDRISTGLTQEDLDLATGTELSNTATATFEVLRQDIASRYCIENSSSESESNIKQEKPNKKQEKQ